ncbi:MAG TPA: hypothetical protein VNH84_17810, partial [Candidatus Saccharimonadales bacterium]|nr:hypothetical protein [Candidatus Saccharimonadales bacterium]
DFLATRKIELLARITKERALSGALTAELKAVAEEFKQSFTIEKATPKASPSEKAPPENAQAQNPK